jgi:hypothetical protein
VRLPTGVLLVVSTNFSQKRIFERYINWFYNEYGNHMIPGHLSHRKCASGSNITKHGLADKTSDKSTMCIFGSEARKTYFLKDVINKIFGKNFFEGLFEF